MSLAFSRGFWVGVGGKRFALVFFGRSVCMMLGYVFVSFVVVCVFVCNFYWALCGCDVFELL